MELNNNVEIFSLKKIVIERKTVVVNNNNVVFQVSQQTYIPQNTVSQNQKLTVNDEKASPVINANAEGEQQNPPPPFLTGVPMVTPGNFPSPNKFNEQYLQYPQQNSIENIVEQPTQQSPSSSAQSMVSNMAAYSSSK